MLTTRRNSHVWTWQEKENDIGRCTYNWQCGSPGTSGRSGIRPKIIGDGLAIEPEQGVLVAPFDGHVIHLIDSHHSLVLGHESGLELLFHIGVNTVSLKGEPFTPHVKSGDKVKQGDVLIEFDMDRIREAGLPVITPVVVANGDAVAELKTKLGPVKKNETEIMEIVMKK